MPAGPCTCPRRRALLPPPPLHQALPSPLPRRHYTSKEELWAHFLRAGAYEGRAFRFTCPYVPQPLR